VRLVKIF